MFSQISRDRVFGQNCVEPPMFAHSKIASHVLYVMHLQLNPEDKGPMQGLLLGPPLLDHAPIGSMYNADDNNYAISSI